MAISRVSQSTVKQGLDKSQTFTAGIPPILGKFYHMGTVEVGAGGASSIEFTGIPAIYKHLQVRGTVLLNRTSPYTGALYMSIRLNSVTSNSYSYHILGGNGASAFADGYGSQNTMISYARSSSSDDLIFSPQVIDILDYADTSKNTTVRVFGGFDANGSGTVALHSGLYVGTNAVSSIQLLCNVNTGGTIRQDSTFALYGVK